VENAEDRASRLPRRDRTVALAAGLKAGLGARARARALESASDGRFNAIAPRVSGQASRVRGMRSAHHDRDARRVSGLRPRDPGLQVKDLIREMKNGAEGRSGSFAAVRGAKQRARVGGIAVRGRSVRSGHAVKASAKDLHRGRRSRFVHAVKVSAKDLHRGHRRHFVRVARVNVRDWSQGRQSRFVRDVKVKGLRHGRQRHFVHAVKVSARDLQRVHRSRIVLVVRENAKDLRRDRRSRSGDVRKGTGRVLRSGRSAVKEGRMPSGAVSRGLAPRRSLVERRDLAASGSSAVNARRVGRLRLEASRSLDRERGM